MLKNLVINIQKISRTSRLILLPSNEIPITDLKDIHKAEGIIQIHEHNEINLFIIFPNARKRTQKKHTVTVEESSNFHKGNVNNDLLLKKKTSRLILLSYCRMYVNVL